MCFSLFILLKITTIYYYVSGIVLYMCSQISFSTLPSISGGIIVLLVNLRYKAIKWLVQGQTVIKLLSSYLNQSYFYLFIIIFLIFIYLSPHGLWNLSCLTRDWAHALLHWKHRVLTTGPPGKSLSLKSKTTVPVSFTCSHFLCIKYRWHCLIAHQHYERYKGIKWDSWSVDKSGLGCVFFVFK